MCLRYLRCNIAAHQDDNIQNIYVIKYIYLYEYKDIRIRVFIEGILILQIFESDLKKRT